MPDSLSDHSDSRDDSHLSEIGRNMMSSSINPSGSGHIRWSPPSVDELAAMLPGYEIVKMLGQGGMGAVFMGRQLSLDRPVAIKILSSDLIEMEAGFSDRFRNEAKSMAKLTHPGIVTVFDFGETETGLLYIVMEYVDGTDVARMIAANGRLHTDNAMAITAHVCDALNYAHQQGIIHRDIKPANIMVGYDGVVKVADFGLAKIHEGDGNTMGLTQSGTMMGTLHYMAPEMMTMDCAVDHRADVYAVGVMLYHMLIGKVPQGMFELPSLQVPGLDPRYDGIVAKAIREERDARYSSAAEMRSDLDAILTQPVAPVKAFTGAAAQMVPALPTQARPQRPGGRRAILTGEAARGGPRESVTRPQSRPSAAVSFWPVAVMGIVLASGGAWWWVKSSQPEPSPENLTTEDSPSLLPQREVSTKPPAPNQAPATSPDPVGVALAPDATSATESAPSPQVETAQPTPPSEPPLPDLSSKEAPLNLVTIPGFSTRLESYLATRNARLNELANKYQGGLDSRFNQAADAGDLTLSRAFSKEKERVDALISASETAPEDLLMAVVDSPDLERLPGDAPPEITELRRVWIREWAAIQSDLDGKLDQSLQLLEAELTRARALDEAKQVRNWRDKRNTLVSVQPASPSSAHSRTGDAAFENSLGMKFVPVPGTNVLFCIHEVRYRDYEKFAKEVKESVDEAWRDQTIDGLEIERDHEDHPVTKVSWEDAQRFCTWLSEKEGQVYRLPTDREWSLAVGIGDLEEWNVGTTPATVLKPPGRFPWGEEWPPPAGAGNYSDESRRKEYSRDVAYYAGYDDGFPTTAPVMSFSPLANGLYDLGGNVWEWCADWWDASEEHRVLRGASWGSGGKGAPFSSARHHQAPDHQSDLIGFRVVRVGEDVVASPPGQMPNPMPQFTVPDPSSASENTPFENSLGMKFVPVAGTEVLFCIHETRRRDYEAYGKDTRSLAPNWDNQTQFHGFQIKDRPDDHPVVYVSWEDAQAFCQWLSEKENRTYRLPTDREWSIALGIGHLENWETDTTPETVFRLQNHFPWGIGWPPPQGAGNFRDRSYGEKTARKENPYIEEYEDGYPATAPVMSFEPNQFGLYDMSGNVCEWVEDWFSDERKLRFLRGGSWGAVEPTLLNSSYRRRKLPDYGRSEFHGFRIVALPSSKSVSEPDELEQRAGNSHN